MHSNVRSCSKCITCPTIKSPPPKCGWLRASWEYCAMVPIIGVDSWLIHSALNGKQTSCQLPPVIVGLRSPSPEGLNGPISWLISDKHVLLSMADDSVATISRWTRVANDVQYCRCCRITPALIETRDVSDDIAATRCRLQSTMIRYDFSLDRYLR